MSKHFFIKAAALFAIGLLAALPAYAGGGGWFIKPLGLMLGGAMLLTILLTKFKQTNITGFVLMGFVMATVAGLPEHTLDELNEHYNGIRSILSGFQQIGIVLIMFMAGLQFNMRDITKRMNLILVNGVGYMGLGLAVFFWAAMQFGGTTSYSESIYFALCMVIPSSILVAAALDNSDSSDSLQGHISTGITVISVLAGVILLAKLNATGSIGQVSETSMVTNLWLTEQLVLLVVILLVLSKVVLKPVVSYLLRDSELLFVSALGYCMGVAAICGYIGISPEAGAFFAGISVGSLPYRLDIEDKVGPLKSFGGALFFLTLGVEMATVQASNYTDNLGGIIALLVLVLIAKPIFLVITGYLSNLKGRTAFTIGTTLNQSSEVSLIIALLAWKSHVFDDRIFAIIVSVVLLSMILSGFGHVIQDGLYNSFKGMVHFLNRDPSAATLEKEENAVFKDHVVLMGFDEIAQEIAEYYEAKGEAVYLIDIDPEIIEYFKARKDSNITPIYADPSDERVWNEYKFSAAKVVVACGWSDMGPNLELAKHMQNNAKDVPLIATTTSHDDALELYENGARYILQTDYLASKKFGTVFAEEIDKPSTEAFVDKGSAHWKDTRTIRDGLGEIFKLV